MTKIDIFSGFLGAGKTTLIKKLLKEAYAGERVVLIENEFGQIGIDSGFLKECGVQITEMNQGCICCSLVGDFSKALAQVLTDFTPDRILIEPSGVGKLSDVIRAVQGVLTEEVVLESFTTVVDANKCKLYMKNFGEFFNDQIENARCIVLSHTDHISEEKLQTCIAMLREHNETATIVTTPWSALDGKQLTAAMEHTNTLEDELARMEHEHQEHHHGHHHHHHDHDECDDPDCCCHHHHDDDEHEHHHGHHHHHHDHDECDDPDCCCHHHHDEDEGEHHHGHHHHHHDHDECDDPDCCCHHHDEDEHHGHHHHHHDHDECADPDCCCHHHDEDEGEHHHGHDECDDPDCDCHHHHHGHHHADDVFTSWGVETARKYTAEEILHALEALDETTYGTVLRAKGIVASVEGDWIHFDYVPGEPDVRTGAADVTGRLCVIGAGLDKPAIAALFGVN